MTMQTVIGRLFRSSDEDQRRQTVEKRVRVSREHVEIAANRLKATIRDLMDENDRLTNRPPFNVPRTNGN